MKKVLSVVLALSLVLGSFSMAFAADTTATKAAGLSDVSGTTNEQAIEVAYNLGIVTGNPDGTYLPAKAVNRAEFAAMITRALGIPASALAGYTSSSFKDTVGYDWAVPYLAFCESKGIMLGDGLGHAMPGRTISTNEAMTMVLRAVGYTSNSSVLVGTWPSNYVSLAKDKGLYDSVAAVTTVDKANAAQIIYNALTITKVQVASDGTTELLTSDATMLESGLDCTKTKDYTVTGTEDAVINIYKYVGQFGDVYENDDDEVIAFDPDCTALTGTFSVEGLSWQDDFNATDADKDYTNNTTTTAIKYFVNGEVKSTLPGTPADADTEYTIYADVTGKTIDRIYSVMKWEVNQDKLVEAADLKDITSDDSFLGEDFYLDDNDKIDLNEFALVGVTSLDKIAADDVVYVYSDSDGIRKIEVGTATVTGVVKDFEATDAAFKIDATKYYNAKSIINGLDDSEMVTDEQVSDTITAYIDARGYVYDYKNDTNSSNTVAFVDAKGAADSISYDARVILNDGTEKVLKAKDNATFVKLTADKLMKYGLNKDGEISTVETPATGFSATTYAIGQVTFTTNKLMKADGKSFVIDSGVVVFTYDGTNIADANNGYDVTTMDKVTKTDATTKEVQILTNDDKEVIAIMVSDKDSKGGTDTYAVINDKYKTTDADGDKVQRIVGFGNGATLDAVTDGESTVGTVNSPTYTSDASVFNPELFTIKVDAKGTVTDADLITSTTTTDDVYKIASFAVTSASGRDSVANGTTYYALADKVVVYEVNDSNDYKIFTGDLKAKDVVVLYETDEDSDGYDVAIICRKGR